MKSETIEDGDLVNAKKVFGEYVDQHEWTFAKTMPECPHFYIVRWDRPDLDHLFCQFAQFIREHGYTQKYHGIERMYFNIGPWKYWTMGSPIYGANEVPKDRNTFILNRAKIESIYGKQD